jgi:hypothetical protein
MLTTGVDGEPRRSRQWAGMNVDDGVDVAEPQKSRRWAGRNVDDGVDIDGPRINRYT